ncbi:MAG: DUF2079 domain-containing protein, partial [Miltoncostaeaceae bacterium]
MRAAAARALRQTPTWLWLAGMCGVFVAVNATLGIARHHAFWAGRFDLGNMVQAVWSTAQGRPLETTSLTGEQFVRLGAHVDPLLVLFTPLAWTGALPEALMVSQAVIVSLGALPAFALGRRWLGTRGWGLAAAGVYLLYPTLHWATVTDMHAVTLAAPLLMACIWGAEERRWGVLGICAPLAALSKEQVGLALAMLGLWVAARGARRAGALLAAGGIGWSLFAVFVVIPHFNPAEGGSAFVSRYGDLGDSELEVLGTILTRPWEVAEVVASADRLGYLAALLLPLLLLPLAAPLLAAGALPDLGINLLSGLESQHSITFHYSAVIAPFLVAASILGLARLRALVERRGWRAPAAGAVMAVWVGSVAVAGVVQGPGPWWRHVPLGSQERASSYAVGEHAAAARAAVDRVPEGVPVSAGNTLGAHLSARRRILMFPTIAAARWVGGGR